METMEYNIYHAKKLYWKQKLKNAEIEHEILTLKLKEAQGF